MDIAPNYSGSASGMMNFGFGVAGIVSPIVFGYLIDRTGSWTLPFAGSDRPVAAWRRPGVPDARGPAVRAIGGGSGRCLTTALLRG